MSQLIVVSGRGSGVRAGSGVDDRRERSAVATVSVGWTGLATRVPFPATRHPFGIGGCNEAHFAVANTNQIVKVP